VFKLDKLKTARFKETVKGYLKVAGYVPLAFILMGALLYAKAREKNYLGD
jgi:hypothetical protein